HTFQRMPALRFRGDKSRSYCKRTCLLLAEGASCQSFKFGFGRHTYQQCADRCGIPGPWETPSLPEKTVGIPSPPQRMPFNHESTACGAACTRIEAWGNGKMVIAIVFPVWWVRSVRSALCQGSTTQIRIPLKSRTATSWLMLEMFRNENFP